MRSFRWVLNSHNGKPPKAPKDFPDTSVQSTGYPPGLENLGKPPPPGLQK